MFELMNGIRSTLEATMAIKPGEQALVIADNEGASMWIGQLTMNVLNSMGAEAVLTVITPRQATGDEALEVSTLGPPASVAAAMKSVNAIFRVSDKHSMVHTTARKEATAAGARYYVIHPSQIDELKNGVSMADRQIIKERTESLAQRLMQANVARVSSPAGTSLTMSLAGRKSLALHSMNRLVGNLHHYSEAAITPVEGTAEGIMVIDMAIVQWAYVLRKPLRCTVKAGRVVDISGPAQDADRLRKIVATDENANNVAELGIGTSHIEHQPVYGTRRDAARIGTAHIGIGRNDDIGGITHSRIHMDGLMEQVTIELDGQPVLKDGNLLI